MSRSRTVVNGRLVDNNDNWSSWNNNYSIRQYFRYFSIYRFIIIISIILLLWFTNPSNIPSQWNTYLLKPPSKSTTTKQQQSNQKSTNNVRSAVESFLSLYNILESYKLLWKQYPIYYKKKRRGYYKSMTNYGIISIAENQSNDISIIGFTGYELYTHSCIINNIDIYDDRYQQRDRNYNMWICDRIRSTLCHEGPLLYHDDNNINKLTNWIKKQEQQSNNYAYTIHRFICWSMILKALWMSCFYRRRRREDDDQYDSITNAFNDGFQTLWYDPYHPMISAFVCCWYNSSFIYPTLYYMNQIISVQHIQSVFKVSNDHIYNYCVSILSLLSIAIAINTLSKIWSKYNKCTLQYHSLIAVSIGYYRGIEPMMIRSNHINQNNIDTSSDYLYPNGPTIITITWVLLLIVYYRKGLVVASLWFIGNFLGYSMGQYQYDNIFIVVTISNLLTNIQNTVQMVYTQFEHLYHQFIVQQ